MNIKLSKLIWTMIAGLMLLGCSFEKIGQKTGKGLSTSLTPAIDSIAKNLVNTIRTELTKDSSRIALQQFIDSLLTPVTLGMRNTIGSARDSFINNQTIKWADSLVQTITGEHLNKNLMVLQASLLGKTKADVYEIENSLQPLLAKMMAEAMGDSTRVRLGLMRDELLGLKTSIALTGIIDTAVIHIVDSSMARLSKRLGADINPLVRDDLSFVRKNAIILISSLAALAAIIITLIWFNRRKYLRMVAMLAKQIDAIPNKEIYDNVTSKIKNEAVTAGLEPTLRGVLKENGLLASESWKKS